MLSRPSEEAVEEMAAYRSSREAPPPTDIKRRSDSAGNKKFHVKKKARTDEDSIYLTYKGAEFFDPGHIHNWLSEVRETPCCSNCVDGRCCLMKHFANESVTGLVNLLKSCFNYTLNGVYIYYRTGMPLFLSFAMFVAN